MWVLRVVYLEVKRVLQVVARLFASQARHHGRARSDLRDDKTICFGQRAGCLADLSHCRHAVGAAAEVELAQRADFAEFGDTEVPVAVR